MSHGGVIEGVIRGLGEPRHEYTGIGAVQVGFDLPWPKAGDCQGVPSCYFIESMVRPDGTFRVVGLPPGDVRIHRLDARWEDDGEDPQRWVTDVVHVESGRVTRVELQGPPPYPPPPG